MCHGTLREVYQLNDTPIANALQTEPFAGEKYPLVLMECEQCAHIQLRDVLTGLFESYPYRTPKAYEGHLKTTAGLLRQRYPKAGSTVEIGANNGLYTDILAGCDFTPIIGVDPAGTHWSCWKSPFSLHIAKKIYKRIGPVDLVVANNVFAHIDDLDEVFEGIDFLLADEGAVIIEVQDFQESLDLGMFDMIYHEHLDQHRPGPWKYLLNRHNLELSAVEHVPPHGGSIRITATRHHRTDWIDPPADWKRYTGLANFAKAMVDKHTYDAAWGATAKLTTLLHNTNVEIPYCVDTTPEKWGKYIPGTGTMIVPEFENGAHKVLLGAWNYFSEFERQFPDKEGVSPYAQRRIYP